MRQQSSQDKKIIVWYELGYTPENVPNYLKNLSLPKLLERQALILEHEETHRTIERLLTSKF